MHLKLLRGWVPTLGLKHRRVPPTALLAALSTAMFNGHSGEHFREKRASQIASVTHPCQLCFFHVLLVGFGISLHFSFKSIVRVGKG